MEDFISSTDLHQEFEDVVEAFSIMAPTAIFYNSLVTPSDYQQQETIRQIHILSQRYHCRNLIATFSSEDCIGSLKPDNLRQISPWIDHIVLLSRDPSSRAYLQKARESGEIGLDISIVRTLKEALEYLRSIALSL